MVSGKLDNSLMFSKNRKHTPAKGKRELPEQYYRMRVKQGQQDKSSFYLELLCPKMKGCINQRDNKKNVRYGDPYMYCRYMPLYHFQPEPPQ